MSDIESNIRDAVRQTKTELETQPNPFAYHDKFTVWEFTKCVLGIVVVPVRLTLVILCILAMAFFSKLSISFGFDHTKPMSPTRRVVQLPVVVFARLLLFVCGYYYIPIKGKRASPKDAMIYVAGPHSTAMDPFILSFACRNSSAVAKDEVRKMPLLGAIGRSSQSIYVKRESQTAKADVLNEIKRRAEDGTWRHLVIFPEGTCTNRTALIGFKKGAFTAGTPVQPVVIRSPFWFFDPTWTAGGPSRLKLILRMMCQVFNRCQVEFLPVYYPSEEEKADPMLYGRNVRDVMAKALGVPTTEHSYEDMFLAKLARKQHVKPEDVLPYEFVELRKLYNLTLDDSKKVLRRYTRVVPKGKRNTNITVEQFGKILGLPLTEPVVELFALLDVEGLGQVDFTSFLVGVTFLSQQTTTDESVDMMFQALDSDSDGKISLKDVETLMKATFKNFNNTKSAGRMFQQADKEGTGVIDKDAFKAFIQTHPELVHVGMEIQSLRKEKGRPLSILNSKRATDMEQDRSQQRGSKAKANDQALTVSLSVESPEA